MVKRNRSSLIRYYTLGILMTLAAVDQAAAQAAFVEVSREAGINHALQVDLATFGGGVAVLDYDNDGFEDLYITGGRAPDVLYRNNGDGTFTDVIEGAGFDRTLELYTQGVSSADINKDGFRDLIVTTFFNMETRLTAPNLLYLNNGDGTFQEVTGSWGFSDYRSNSQGATFGDINNDGYVDIYISNYFSNNLEGVSVFNEETIVNSFVAATDFLFINAGGERFIEVSGIYGMDHDGFGFQGLLTDFDNDRDLDIYIANDFGFRRTPNVLLENRYPESELSDRSLNLAVNHGMNAMGMGASDNNNDGLLDYFISNLAASVHVINQGVGFPFFDNTAASGTGITTIVEENYSGPPISWGCNFFDYDHDLDVDLFVNNGALNPTIRLNPNFFFEYENGRYVERSAELGLNDYRIGRGSAVFDYDNDGDLDLIVINQVPRDPSNLLTLSDPRSLLYRNDNEVGNWLKVKLQGSSVDLDGIGSRVEAWVGGRLLSREIDGGSSHLSQNSTIAHFGLAGFSSVDTLTVKWLGGGIQKFYDVEVNQLFIIDEELNVVEESFENSLEVFPTYFDQDLTIRFSRSSNTAMEVLVHDEKGTLIDTIETDRLAEAEGFINWVAPPDLPRGVYFFSLRGSGEKVVSRAVKR